MRRIDHSSARRVTLLVLAFAPLAACRAPEPREAAEITPVEPPEAWQANTEDTSPTTPLGEWWREFADPRLDEVVELVLAQNHDLAAAAARVAQARAQAKIAGAANLPTVSVGADGARQRQNFVGLPIGGGGVLSSLSTSYGVSLDVSWELDLWGALDAQEKAAVADVRASQADLRGAHLSLAAQTVKLWCALAVPSGCPRSS